MTLQDRQKTGVLGAGVFSDEELAILETYRVPRPQQWAVTSPALLIIDVVESFAGADLPVERAQRECVTACGENAWRAIEHIAELLRAFRAAALPVVYSVLDSLPPAPGFQSRRGPSALRGDVVVEPLAPVVGDLVLSKVKPSAFFGTPLMTWLTSRGVDQVVVVGGATSGCVRGTVLDAYSYGLDVLLPQDGCFDRVNTSHVVTLTDLDTKYCRVVDSADVIERLADL